MLNAYLVMPTIRFHFSSIYSVIVSSNSAGKEQGTQSIVRDRKGGERVGHPPVSIVRVSNGPGLRVVGGGPF